MFLAKNEYGHDTKLVTVIKESSLITYQYHMINYSNQSHFLKMHRDASNLEFFITTYMPIELHFRNACHTYSEIKKLFNAVIDAIESTDEFLLCKSQIILMKEYIFYDLSTQKIKLLYMPINQKSVSVHKQIKQVFLSLIYEHIGFNKLIKDQRIQNMITSIQHDNFNLYVFKSMSHNHKTKKIKRPWYDAFYETISQKSQTHKRIDDLVSEPVIVHETVMLKNTIYPTLNFGHKKISINKDSFLIGRSEQLNDFSIPKSLSIGRVHAEIIREDDDYYIIDINTKNGTYINGSRLQSQTKYNLNTGDVIQIANEKVIFE